MFGVFVGVVIVGFLIFERVLWMYVFWGWFLDEVYGI